MTKHHPLHRKKAINMVFRHSFKVQRLFYKVMTVADKIKYEGQKVIR